MWGSLGGAWQQVAKPPQLFAFTASGNATPPRRGVSPGPARAQAQAVQRSSLVPGMSVEAEWVPGNWCAGKVVEVAANGSCTIIYKDGYSQSGLPASRVRPAGLTDASNLWHIGPPAAGVQGLPGHKHQAPPPPPPAAMLDWGASAGKSPQDYGRCGTYQKVDATQDNMVRMELTTKDNLVRVDPFARSKEAQEPDREPCSTRDVRGALAHAVASRDIMKLQAALEEAKHAGLYGAEVKDARDVLLELEATGNQKQASQLVEEAIESDDWWKLQAAMQTAIGAGLPQPQVSRLQEAMKNSQRRREAIKNLQKAQEAGDSAKLRLAIEAALKEHVKEPHVKRARDALNEIEEKRRRDEEEKKASTLLELRVQQAASKKCLQTLRTTVEDLEKRRLKDEERAVPEQKQAEILSAARAELRSQTLERLNQLLQREDMEGLARCLQDAPSCGVEEATLSDFNDRLQTLRLHDHHRQQLKKAVQVGARSYLHSALEAAKAAGLRNEHLRSAREALGICEAREKEQDRRERAAEELHDAAAGDDLERLVAACAEAERAGLSGAQAVPAMQKLQSLRARDSATRELREAVVSPDLYRLRAAIATARAASVDEEELARARSALNSRSAQAQARRDLEAAIASRDAELLGHAIQVAKQAGVSKPEVAQAEAALRSASHLSVGGELRAAMQSGDVERLRTAASAAVDAGMMGYEVNAAWEQVRALECHAWARRELDNAISSGDGARLQAAITHAETSGVSLELLAPARRKLASLASCRKAEQELRLARASGCARVLREALKAALDAGVAGSSVEHAEAELRALERGGAWRPPPPAVAPPPPPPLEPGEEEDNGEAMFQLLEIAADVAKTSGPSTAKACSGANSGVAGLDRPKSGHSADSPQPEKEPESLATGPLGVAADVLPGMGPRLGAACCRQPQADEANDSIDFDVLSPTSFQVEQSPMSVVEPPLTDPHFHIMDGDSPSAGPSQFQWPSEVDASPGARADGSSKSRERAIVSV